MSKLKLYALALTARKYDKNRVDKIVTRPAACIARDRDHAVGRGITSAKKLWPSEESWFGHAASATEIPSYLVEIVYQEIENANTRSAFDANN